MSLKDKLLKNSVIKQTDMFDTTDVLDLSEIKTDVAALNIALSGDVDSGMHSGLLMIAGPSKHFKTLFGLIMARSFQNENPDGIILFYDTEFGAKDSYFKSLGLDTSRIVHTPLTNIEEFKFDIVNQLEHVDKKDKLFILVDSIGNIASKKELDDAKDGSSKQDMSRAKSLKSLFRLVTPYLTLKDIPLVVVNHIYMEQALYPRAIVSGGSGAIYSSNDIWIIGKNQMKDGKDLMGSKFIINIEKSRLVKEKSKIPIEVSFADGINKYSGLLDLAKEFGLVTVNMARITRNHIPDDKKRKEAECDKEWWDSLFNETNFKELIKDKYQLSSHNLLGD